MDIFYPGQAEVWPFASAAGEDGTTAVSKDDPAIVGWATGFTEIIYGASVAERWQTPEKSLGPAEGNSLDVVVLGRGGSVTLSFTNPITNGPGADFAVFENSFSPTFLELAWVEVSSDGEHFVRFPNLSYVPAPESGSVGAVDPTDLFGFAGKYQQGFGTPFDLETLADVRTAIRDGTDAFAPDFREAFTNGFEGGTGLDLESIRYIRLVDVVGDGSAVDAGDVAVYDPYPTTGSAGFDLDAVAVLNEAAPNGLDQTITFPSIGNRRLDDGPLALNASSTSGLPVVFELLEGPATLRQGALDFNGPGRIVVRATQPGDAAYAPADPVTRRFEVADALQHIYLEPIPNLLAGTSDFPVHVASTSGLPVRLFVDAGPGDAVVSSESQSFSSGGTPGAVTLRASQPGGEIDGVTYAAAADVFGRFELIAPGEPGAPRAFSEWQAVHGLSGSAARDSDGDGLSDLEEYAVGSDPTDAAEQQRFEFEASGESVTFEIRVSDRARSRLQLQASEGLGATAAWEAVLPEIVESRAVGTAEAPAKRLRLRAPKRPEDREFWRFVFEPY